MKWIYAIVLIILTTLFTFGAIFTYEFVCLYDAHHHKSFLKRHRTYIPPKHKFTEKLDVHVTWVGIVKDIDVFLERNIPRVIDVSRQCVRSFDIFIYENDSTDRTKEVLDQFAVTYPHLITVQHETLYEPDAHSHGGLSLKRFEKMAFFRNKCVDHVQSIPTQTNHIVAVMDWDHTVGINSDIFFALKAVNSEWDMVAANGIKYVNYHLLRWVPFIQTNYYYDNLAFRNQSYQRTKSHKQPGETYKGLSEDQMFTGATPIPITSAGGGLIFYRKEIFDHCKYDGYDCEHICFHDDMIRHGFDKMFILPHMILYH